MSGFNDQEDDFFSEMEMKQPPKPQQQNVEDMFGEEEPRADEEREAPAQQVDANMEQQMLRRQKMREHEEEREQRIQEKRSLSQGKLKEIVEKAAQFKENFKIERSQKIDKNVRVNRDEEAKYLHTIELEEQKEETNIWARVMRFVDLKKVKSQTDVEQDNVAAQAEEMSKKKKQEQPQMPQMSQMSQMSQMQMPQQPAASEKKEKSKKIEVKDTTRMKKLLLELKNAQ